MENLEKKERKERDHKIEIEKTKMASARQHLPLPIDLWMNAVESTGRLPSAGKRRAR